MKTGNTTTALPLRSTSAMPQWSPVMKTGNTAEGQPDEIPTVEPQWSPVMKTGNTWAILRIAPGQCASMEPGHEDREYQIITNKFQEIQ